MKAKQLKRFLDKLSKEELERDVVVVSTASCTSGPIEKLKKAPHNLLWDGEDDPSELHTRSWFLKEGFEIEDVDSFTVEVNKGDIVIQIH